MFVSRLELENYLLKTSEAVKQVINTPAATVERYTVNGSWVAVVARDVDSSITTYELRHGS